jgi:APA family basic amino acid/polyamine antiporter
MSGARTIGIWTAAALVVGNMIGSGLFLLPASLAPYGAGSLLGWAISGCGAIALALVFARLGLLLPRSGGPYAFARAAFGDGTGFMVAWGYWISIWCGNAAIAIAFAGALQKLLPIALQTPQSGLVIALVAIWTCTGFNLRGIALAGRVQLVSTILKLAPLALLIVYALIVLAIERPPLPPLQPDPAVSLLQTAQATAALCLWAFLGLESATNAADAVRDPERTVPRATLLGTLAAIIVTVLACTVVMLLVPITTLAQSGAPFVDAAAALWGGPMGTVFAITAAIAAFGTLNGWILMQGQIPLAAARDGLFPQPFARVDGNGTPLLALIVGSALASMLVFANFNEALVRVFTFSILLSTAATLVPYVVCTLALLMPSLRRQRAAGSGLVAITVFALVYSLWALWGTGRESLLWGTVLFAIGVPVYLLSRRKV